MLIIGLSIAYPRNRLISWHMAFGTVAGTILFVFAVMLWNKLYPIVRKATALYWICLCGFGIALFVCSLNRLNNYQTLVDYSQVYHAAKDVAAGIQPENAYYFRRYSNNYKPMLLLALLFRMADLLGIAQPYFTLAISVLEVVLTVWACGYLLSKGDDKKWRFPTLIAFVAFLPVWAMTSAFYTDTMSFGLAVQALAYVKKALAVKQRNKAGYFILSIAAGACVVLAIAWKITAIVILIAYGIVVILKKGNGRKKECLPFLVAIVLSYVLLNAWVGTYELSKEIKHTSNPIISWVALGMTGDGSWGNNSDYGDTLNSLLTKEEKTDFSISYMQEHWDECFSTTHFQKKLCCNFADGNLGTRDFFYIENDDGTLLWHLFSPWGKYYWRTSQYCFCYMSVIYVSFLLGMMRCIGMLKRREEIPDLLMACQLGFLGIFAFLMVWEANNRQLYNQMPYFIIGAIMSMDLVVSKFKGIKRK